MKKKSQLPVDVSNGEIILPKIKTQLTAHLYPKHLEKNLLPSKTVPDMSMTIKDMVARHRKGLPIDQAKGALYQGDELVADISKMDLIDRQNYIDSVADALVEVRARLTEQAKTKQEKEFLAKVDEGIRIKMDELSKNINKPDK